jgi:hypothetical protein
MTKAELRAEQAAMRHRNSLASRQGVMPPLLREEAQIKGEVAVLGKLKVRSLWAYVVDCGTEPVRTFQ